MKLSAIQKAELMSDYEIRLCTECGKPIDRDTQKDHILRKRNSLSAVNDTCASCNNQYLEKWDLSGELPPGPHDALLNVARRSVLLAQWVGDTDVSDVMRDLETYGLAVWGWEPTRRKRRRGTVVDDRSVIVAVKDDASRWRKFWSYLSTYIPYEYFTEHQLILNYARKIESNPALFVEWWESSDHSSLESAFAKMLKGLSDSGASSGTIQQHMMTVLITEACTFPNWLLGRLSHQKVDIS
jgi:hypothetical protein